MKKKALLFFIIPLILVLCTGCGKKNSKDTIVLKVLAGQSTTDAGIEDMIDAAIKEKYPDISLEWETIGWGADFHAKMQQYMQSGLPDIFIGKAQDVATYGSQDILADLTGKDYLSNVYDAAIPGVTINGKIYGVVYNALYQGVYYNRKIFKEQGITPPETLDELNAVISKLKAAGVTPFATHYADLWSIGNITMQFAINDVFRNTPDWGDKFRSSEVSFVSSPEYRKCYEYNMLIYNNTWKDKAFSVPQTEADVSLVQDKAAMKVSGSWSIQNFIDIDENFDFGVFPFPNQTGDSKLIFEPNITFMKSASTENSDAVDKVLSEITGNKALALEIYNFTKTAPMIKGVTPTFKNPSQKDIDIYAQQNNIVDANIGNTQLQWGGFQEENAKDISEWLQGNITIDQALEAADSRRQNSKP